MSDCIKIMSLNCRGLADLHKRRDVLNYIKSKQYSICCLQDTHFTDRDLNYVRTIWGFNVCISPGRSDARGVAVLFNNNFDFKLVKEKIDNVGNLLILEILIEEKH